MDGDCLPYEQKVTLQGITSSSMEKLFVISPGLILNGATKKHAVFLGDSSQKTLEAYDFGSA